MSPILKSALAVSALTCATHVSAQVPPRITFYERPDFQGRQFTTQRDVRNLERHGFNDRASSADVVGRRWEVCEDARFSGRCVILRPGRYPSLASMGVNNSISSVRLLTRGARIDDNRYAPEPPAVYDGRDYRRRGGERLYEAPVVAVRAVVATPEQRCWIEQEQVPVERRPSVGGAVAGAVIGGILGHQIGRGRDVATVGGAVAGGAIGSQVGGRSGTEVRDVQKCASVPSATPTYYDVTYNFRGQEHHVQMTAPPARQTVTVNDRGEPRA